MTTLDITIDNRDLTVRFGWEYPCPASFTDPGSKGGPEIESVWEDSNVAVVSDDECDLIVAEIERVARECCNERAD